MVVGGFGGGLRGQLVVIGGCCSWGFMGSVGAIIVVVVECMRSRGGVVMLVCVVGVV